MYQMGRRARFPAMPRGEVADEPTTSDARRTVQTAEQGFPTSHAYIYISQSIHPSTAPNRPSGAAARAPYPTTNPAPRQPAAPAPKRTHDTTHHAPGVERVRLDERTHAREARALVHRDGRRLLALRPRRREVRVRGERRARHLCRGALPSACVCVCGDGEDALMIPSSTSRAAPAMCASMHAAQRAAKSGPALNGAHRMNWCVVAISCVCVSSVGPCSVCGACPAARCLMYPDRASPCPRRGTGPLSGKHGRRPSVCLSH